MNEFRVSSNPPTASSWSAEEEADRLMDDVFSDIDSLLTGKRPTAKIQTAPQSDYTSLQSLVVPQIDLEGSPAEASDEQVVIKRGIGYYTERLLFMGSCASLIGVALWMAVNDRLRVPQFLIQPTPVVETAAETETAAATEPIFADYVRRALDNIDRQRSPQPIPVNPAGQPSAATVPTTDQQPQNGNSQVIERIYIPVYPPEISANARPPLPNNAPVITPSPQVVQPPQVQTPPPQIAPAPPEQTIPDLQAVVPTLPAPPAAAKELYTLVGVLESGDRSAALFNINGVTQRFRVGENIGASNWKLLSVQNQQILMGQGGQTRSLYVGQNFGIERE